MRPGKTALWAYDLTLDWPEGVVLTPVAPAPSPVQPAPLEDRLVRQWTPLAYRIARDFYIPGGDYRDVRQEALVALLDGLRRYDGRASLKMFLSLVVRRRLSTAVRLARGQKHEPLNWAGGLDEDVHGCVCDPVEIIETRDELRRLLGAVRSLTPLERRALLCVINGEPYAADGVKDKSIDNAVQRAKRKLREAA